MKIINLFAGHCTEKSTLSLMLKMKKMGLKCKLIPDLPRDDVFSESGKRLNAHLLQLTNLQHKLNMLKNTGIDYVIMESPIVMRLAYAANEPKIFKDLVIGLHNEQDSVNIHLLRNPEFKYDETGRDQKEDEAKERSNVIKNLVEQHIPDYLNIVAGIRADSLILNFLGLEDELSQKELLNIHKNKKKIASIA